MKRLLPLLLLSALLLSGCGVPDTLTPRESASEVPLQSSAPSPSPEPEERPEEQPLSDEEYIQKLIGGMTLEEKVGQLFLARCPKEDAAALAAQYHLGGYVLFSGDFKNRTPQQVREDIAGYQAASGLPLLIAVDEEGGTVTRVSRYAQFRDAPFLSPRELYEKGGYELIAADTAEKAGLLSWLGINVNMAPVCDLSDDPEDYMYQRSFSGDPDAAARYVSTVVSVMEQCDMGSCLKHFPGYGNNADTHTGLAYDPRSYDSFTSADFVPFQAGIEAGADCVLVCHNIVSCMDPDLPASLSPEVHRVLREELGFDGVVVTDDLVMEAITQYTGGEEAAVLAVLAGNDLLCCTDFQTQIPAVIQAVNSGRISLEQVEQAAARVLQWKLELGLLSVPG